ncbi:MAG: YdeI/OmpD-associated family protein [Dokdonella sp.]|uniref:YdeI/OmpD-associated family protein n=1 Tax=Dokdonella sp. TaxID=2291710 RepID=UPI003BB0363E
MPTRDPRIDAYIKRSAGFAQPILEHLRALVRESCPQVEETIKWGFPHFVHAGGILCSMAAFKQHAAFGFWNGELIDAAATAGGDRGAMGQFGRLQSLADLPGKRALAALIRKAMTLNEEGVKRPAAMRDPARAEMAMPAELAAALIRHLKARKHFETFAPGQQREYKEWIAEAKQTTTRERRLAQAIEWLAEGKPRNWKYMAAKPAAAGKTRKPREP